MQQSKNQKGEKYHDDLTTFLHIKFHDQIIKAPKNVIIATYQDVKEKEFIFGCYIPPCEEEIINIMEDYLYGHGYIELFTFKKYKLNIKIKKL